MAPFQGVCAGFPATLPASCLSPWGRQQPDTFFSALKLGAGAASSVLSLLALGGAYSLQTLSALLSSERTLGLSRGTVVVVWSRIMSPLWRMWSTNTAEMAILLLTAPAPSISAALAVREMPFQRWLGRINLLSKEQAAGTLQLGLQVND